MRETLATFTEYKDAEAAVDKLSDNGFPVEHTQIIGTGIRYVENVTGRSNIWKRTLGGMASGAWAGLFIGLLFSLFDWYGTVGSTLSLILGAVIFGAIAGAVVGVLNQLMSGGRRDFASIGSMSAEQYEVTVDNTKAAEARKILGLEAVVDLDTKTNI